MANPSRDALTFPLSESQKLDTYLPSSHLPPDKIHVTLTFATSLDSSLSLSPGVQTALSGPASKAMTHYLRSKHDAILIGVGTLIADDPSLNCRIEGVGGYGGEGLVGQPRPVVLDPRRRWPIRKESKVVQLAGGGRGRGPWVISIEKDEETVEDRPGEAVLAEVRGRMLGIPASACSSSEAGFRMDWRSVFALLLREGIRSVMIEGGGAIINDLLHPSNFTLVDTVIVTIAPTWLGQGGVQVCPDARVEGGAKVPVGRLQHVKWVPLGDDVVLCGRP